MIDQWESGARAIPADRVEEIAEATGVVAPGSEPVAEHEETRAVPATELANDDAE